MKPEHIALAVNLMSSAYYIYHGAEPGKILYWIGATILTGGLCLMRG